MKIVSYNVNGIRAAMKKGLLDWLQDVQADVICLQETKASEGDIDIKKLENLGYHHHWFSAQKKGYSGVATFTRKKPDSVKMGCGFEMSDYEGRVVEVQFGDTKIINAYFPSGTSGEERQSYKYVWLDEMYGYLSEQAKNNPKLVLCGDYNIAHKEIDIHDPKGNKKSSGFLPEERAWLDKFIDSGWIDTFREFNKEPHHYTWWSQRFPSVRLNNKGWRIDYIMVTEALRSQLQSATIFPHAKHSDHCPIMTEINL